jgi:hypothetical protein
MTGREPKNVAERQSIDIVHATVLQEFIQYRNEIIERLRFQKQLERLSLFVVAALIGGLQFLVSADAELTLLLGSLLLFGIATSFFGEDINIVFAASYIEKRIKPNLLSLLRDYPSVKHQILGWEDYRHERFLPTAVSTVMTINRNISAFLPGLLAFFGFIYSKGLGNNFEFGTLLWTNLEILLMVANLVAFLFLTYLAIKVPAMYRFVSRD